MEKHTTRSESPQKKHTLKPSENKNSEKDNKSHEASRPSRPHNEKIPKMQRTADGTIEENQEEQAP